MRSRAVRLTLTLLAVGAIAAATYLFVSIERRSTAAAAATRDFDARIATALRQALELRAAQQAYVAAGQSEQFWFTKSAALLASLRESVTALRAGAVSAASLAALDAVQEGTQEFERMDQRARAYVSSSQHLLASDLIFSDGFESTEQILSALDRARQAEASGLAASQAAARREQLMYAAAGVAVPLIAVLLLLPTPRVEEPATAPVAPSMMIPSSSEGLDLGHAFDAEFPLSAKPVAATAIEVQAPDFDSVASVCTELARVSDTAALPALLERTAAALDASGIVLWIADPDGKELTPVVSHGYPPSMLSRMGSIPKDADNVTAAAFRTGLLQIVKADEMSHGAIAAPLVNPSGCIGVMSAEVRHDGESHPARVAVAAIVAAQLATLVAPPTARDTRTAAL